MSEIFVKLPAVRRIGVFPFGAHVRETVGTSKNPLSSRKPKWAPSAAVFFCARPHVLLPVPNGFLVSLPIAFAGLLATPAYGPHQFPHIRYGIADAELPSNHLADASQRPEVGRISGFQGPLQEQSGQAFLLSLVQQWCPAGRCLRTQSSLAIVSVRLLPTYHRTE